MHHEEEKGCCCHEHDHHHEEHEECCCGHDHEDHECHCGHDHEEHEECCCGHDHGHEHHHHGGGCACCEGEHEELTKSGLIILIARIATALALIIIGSIPGLLTEKHCIELVGSNLGAGINHTIMFAAWLIVAYDVAWKAIKGLFKGGNPFNEFLLMTIASIGAFCLRLLPPFENEFMEGALVMLLYQIGEVFSDIAADKSKDAITKAIDLREEEAQVEAENGFITKKPEELSVGDIVVTKVGEKILCDGSVYQGEGSVDESSLTGESLPIDKKVGDQIMSGTILKSGSIKVKVEKLYADSTVAKMLDLVEESAEKKAKSERFITRFAKVYTPIVTALALFVAIVPSIFDGNWSGWIYTALCFLVISCPCSVVISVPLAFFSGLGLASKNGVIIKGAEYFDKLKSLKYIAFDKTGTLTEGRMSVAQIHANGIDEKQFVEYVAAAETRSSHPIAKALVAYANDESIAKKVSEYEEISGSGIHAVYEGHDLYVGKAGLLVSKGLEVEAVEMLGTAIYLSVDGEYRGYCVLQDTVRESVPSAMLGLKENGVTTILVSGDKKATVQATAESLDIAECYGECLPEDKAKILSEKIAAKKGSVAFVGDGINDAPSIVLADVGIAMGGLGSDMAVANADVVLMNDDPAKVLTAIKVAKATERRATFNIIFSLSVKLIVMIVSILSEVFHWGFPLWAAVICDTGLSLLMVLSSLMLSFKKID